MEVEEEEGEGGGEVEVIQKMEVNLAPLPPKGKLQRIRKGRKPSHRLRSLAQTTTTMSRNMMMNGGMKHGPSTMEKLMRNGDGRAGEHNGGRGTTSPGWREKLL